MSYAEPTPEEARDFMANYESWLYNGGDFFDMDIMHVHKCLRVLGCPFTDRGYLCEIEGVPFDESMKHFEQNYKAVFDKILAAYQKRKKEKSRQWRVQAIGQLRSWLTISTRK